MKKMTFSLLVFFILAGAAIAQPGGGGFQRQTPEQRVELIHKKLDSAFSLGAEKFKVLDSALLILFKAQDTRMQELFAGGNMPDRETMMAERKKYTDARDEMIKAMVTEEQFKIWIEKIIPSMRPPGPPGGGRPGGGNN